jgi:hypothetical protein
MSYHHQNNSKSMRIVNGIILIIMLLMIAMFFHQQVQSIINEGRLKFVQSPQMKLDKDRSQRT